MTLAATEKGYITKSQFHQYGLAFIKYLKANGLADKTNLLILDGHKSHLYNLPFYEAMRANNVEILTIPPHTSHIIQPLDSVPFAQFKKSWENHLMKYNTSHSGHAVPSISIGLPWAQPRQPPTKPISSDVQATHKKRPVEEKEDEPPAKRCLIRHSSSAEPVSGAVAGGDQQEIVVLADVHRENMDEEGTSMSFQVTQYNQM